MSLGRFALCVVVAYIVYAVLYMGTMMGIFAETFMANASLMRPADDPLIPYMYLAHLGQTVAVVWLFDKAVGSNDVKAGATFGFWIGLYLAATDASTYVGMNVSTDPLLVSVIIHLAVGAIVGAVLAKLYKPAEEAVAAEE